MPMFDHETVRALVGNLANGEHTLDLRGVPLLTARAAITQMLEQRQPEALTSVVIRIDPATATSGETLFLPVGQQLLQARRQGLITRFHPLPEADGGGFYAELPGRAQHEGAQP
ncbi:MAG: hypothetical protein AAGA68_16470 [Pseudomonadota bacterium]